ncbi:lysozyme inhibitor LprI family protein [Metabacillus endolithicus]|uniref:Lysozyme inhibitor LprI family protein n=1 Tax=Metabacillus endolithicus TaxID=1535204 RepID=A0ABW5C1N0_9BACI|nr:lysozyme inhibitor LprI family protein [Metabacillus endolithicus]UPG65213.1 lysozyme inhibitor LprI family protein [Metabacillus endolithicus]
MKSIFTVLALFVLLVGCNNQNNSDQNEAPTKENEETKTDSNEETQSNEEDNSEKQENDITEENNTEETDTTIGKDSQQAAEDESEGENISEESDVSEGNKQKYLEKLNSIEKAAVEIRKNNDGTTFGMRKSQEEILGKWDQALNEIYQVLEKQLPADEMEILRQEQRKWITLRDETAKEDASQFEGGTMEPLEYTASLANTTKERCYELVENYMK